MSAKTFGTAPLISTRSSITSPEQTCCKTNNVIEAKNKLVEQAHLLLTISFTFAFIQIIDLRKRKLELTKIGIGSKENCP